MSFNQDGILDIDEGLRALQLVSTSEGEDVVMEITNKGTVVEGESLRQYEGSNAGKGLLGVAGYHFFVRSHAEKGKKGVSRLLALSVIRKCDAATASLLSLLNSGSEEIKVKLSVFKASGDSAKSAQPTLQFVLEEASIIGMAILTSDALQGPHELITLDYASIQIDSAPQTKTGQRGAVRTCTFVSPKK
jgi:type VI protein secretion system component Hcp